MSIFDELEEAGHVAGEIVETHLPCHDCGSSDALTKYTTNTYCFSCLKRRPIEGAETVREIENVMEFTKGKIGSIIERSLNKETCKLYGVACLLDERNQILKHIYPYYKGHDKVAQKIRTVADKSFFIEGTLNSKSELFGQQLFHSHSKKYLIVTEGELDAMAANQMVGGIYAAVSIPNGAQSAVTAFKANFEFINLFEHVILAFDNDEQGRKAASEVAQLFATGKAKILNFPKGIKDACDMLIANRNKEFIELVYNCEPYRPEGITDLYDLKDKFLERREKLVTNNRLYPYECLNRATYGIRQGELVIVTAPTGVGKTSFLREVQEHILTTTNDKIGVMYIEESGEDTFGLSMGIRMNQPIHLPDQELNKTELQKAMDSIGKGRVWVYQHFGTTALNKILDRIRYMKQALGCDVIILDHISMLIDERYDDERRALDNIVYKLKLLAVELDVAILAVSHLNRQGQLRGTASIEQLANICIMLERDKLNDDTKVKMTSKVIVFKNRFCGREGLVGYLTYDAITNRLEEDNEYKETEAKGFKDTTISGGSDFGSESTGNSFASGGL